MSKRFTETEKWKDDWYLNLSNDYRIIWQYLLDNCSIAGIIKISFIHLNFCCKTNISEKDLYPVFSGRVLKVENYYFIPKFITYQYASGLNSQKPAIVSVREQLKKYGLIDDDNNLIYDDNTIIPESLPNDNGTIKAEKQPKKERKTKQSAILFSESEYIDYDKFKTAFFENENYREYDVKFYYEAVKNWSAAGNNKKADWIATARNWALRDYKENKLKNNNGYKANNGYGSNGISKQGQIISEQLAAREILANR